MDIQLNKTDCKIIRLALDTMRERAESSEHLASKHAGHITYLRELSELMTTAINKDEKTFQVVGGTH